MVPAIGVMIGCYIITRMVELLLPNTQDWAKFVVGAVAVLTLLITGVMMADLITGAQSATPDIGCIYPDFPMP